MDNKIQDITNQIIKCHQLTIEHRLAFLNTPSAVKRDEHLAAIDYWVRTRIRLITQLRNRLNDKP